MLHELKKSSGRTKAGKRLGRGDRSGAGNYCGRGMKGQKARAGGNVPAWFEGGQTPLHMRLPKLRGFKRYFKLLKFYEPINVGQLEADERVVVWATLDKTNLTKFGYLRKPTSLVKILGTGALKKSLSFTGIDAVSASALTKIEKAGGSVALLEQPLPTKQMQQQQ